MSATTVTGWLLDTHALLWMLHGDKRLSKKAAQAKRLGLGIISVDEIIDSYQIKRVW